MKIRSALFLLLTGGLLFFALYAAAADLGQFGGGDGRGDTMAEIVRLFAGGDGRGDAMAEILGYTMNSITVTSPNGGESWMVGTPHNIIWTSSGTVGNVNIHYSLNNGSTWTSIVSGTANDGLYEWTIPSVTPSATCLVRVQEADGDPTDQSDAVFSIVANSVETISTPSTPTGPASGNVGTIYTYSTGGSTSSWGDDVQYLFDWDDGSDSGWLDVGITTASHGWSAGGTFNVRARARCSIHTAVESAWSTAYAVTQDDDPTWVAVTRFAACASESQPTVEWHTGTEIGTVGFNLWRQDRETKEYTLVNPSFLPSLANAPRGGIYHLADPGAFSGEPVVYRLDEVDSQGRVRSYGPFTVTFGGAAQQEPDDSGARMGREEPTDIYGFQRFGRARTTSELERLSARRQEQQRSAMLAAQGKDRVRVTVKGRGLFYVTAAQVANSLGMSETGAAALIRGYKLGLTGMGKEIAWLADGNGAGLFFYNEGIETAFSSRNVYWLERGSGRAMETINAGSAGPADAGQSYQETLHFEENRWALTSLFSSTEDDIWLWDYVIGGGGAKSFSIDVPGVAGTGKAMLIVALQGTTDTAADNDHHAIVMLNGSNIGGAFWDGTKAHTFEITFDASLLHDGANTIAVSGVLDMGAPHSMFYVESFDLSYQRLYKAVNNALLCRGDGNRVVTVSGLTEAQAVILNVSDAARPKQLTGAVPDLVGRVTFVPRSGDALHLVSGLNAALRPLAVVGDRPAQLKGSSHSAEYIVITPEEFKATAQELADYRQGKGLKSLVVTLEDIYEVFNYGMPSPYAIRDFLAHAYDKWSGKKVKYAVLAGKGTYDYQDHLGHGDNLVPVILGRSSYGLFAADKTFGDVTGKNGLPEIAIGRLPAVTNTELQAMIDKIKAYESGQGEWTGKALMIADDGGDFAQSCNELAGLAAGFQLEKIYLNGSAQETRSRIIASWNAGAGMVGYCGHAGLNQLTQENIFNVADAVALQNGGRLPLTVMLTCVAGRFEIPGSMCLGETLMLNGNGGMAAGLWPSGLEMNEQSLRLGGEFVRLAIRSGTTVGKALLAAMKSYLQLGGNALLLNVYNWLGDPALAFK